MSPLQHQRVRRLFEEALTRPRPERLSYVKSACPDDTEVLEEAQGLIQAHDAAQGFLEPQPEKYIGRYRITGELGSGGMGIVYEAYDPQMERTVAIKVINLGRFGSPAEAKDLRERLFREARLAGSLSHPGIIVVFDVGQEQDQAFIVMERVEGPTLQQILAATPRQDPVAALDILRQTALALDCAHGNSIVHRDIKPANIMLHKKVVVKVADFGIAKLASSTRLTRSGELFGTPPYMSPEQIQVKDISGRSDQFSLAVVAFEMLTGRRPFEAEAVLPLLQQIVQGRRPSARAINPSLPPGVDRVLQRALSIEPAERYGSCEEFAIALDTALLGTPEGARNMDLEALLAHARQAIAAGNPRAAAEVLESGRERFGRQVAWRMLRQKVLREEQKSERSGAAHSGA